jgi:hypothetical protein
MAVPDWIDRPMLAQLTAPVAGGRATVWKWGLRHEQVTLDFHSTLVEVESENKEQAAPNWKHGFGYRPLLVYLDQTGEAVAGTPRPGNAGANTSQTTSNCWMRHSLNCHAPPAGGPGAGPGGAGEDSLGPTMTS